MMKKSKKYALYIALIMIVAGAAIFFIAFAAAGFNFKNLSTEKIATQNVEIKEQFQRISVSSNEYDLKILKSEGEKCKAVFVGNEKQSLVCNVKDGELVVDLKDNRKWYDKMIEINLQSGLGITVYLPEKEYDALSASSYSGDIDIDSGFTFGETGIDAMSGSIKASGITAKKLDIQSYSGKIDVSDISASDNLNIGTTSGAINAENVNANNVVVNSYSGKANLKNTVAKGSLSIEAMSGDVVFNGSADSITVNTYSGEVNLEGSTAETSLYVETMSGDVVFNGCDSGEITVNTYSGGVSGTLLSDKIFVTSTYSGNVNVPVSSGTDKCTINTTSGNINIFVARL